MDKVIPLFDPSIRELPTARALEYDLKSLENARDTKLQKIEVEIANETENALRK